jgi:nucleoid-associated protein YgaU
VDNRLTSAANYGWMNQTTPNDRLAMDGKRVSSLLLGSLLVLAACGLGLRVTWWLVADPVAAVAGPVRDHGTAGLLALPPVTAVEGCCGLALAVSAGWLAANTLLTLTSHVVEAVGPRTTLARLLSALRDRTCPGLARSAVAATLGVVVGAAATGSALATPAGPTDGAGPVLTGLRLPDRTTGGMAATPTRTAPPPVPRVVVVHPGDCLWSLAARLLPATSSDATTTTAWHRLHRANAARLGDDPDLILPGTRLVVPPLADLSRKDLP